MAIVRRPFRPRKLVSEVQVSSDRVPVVNDADCDERRQPVKLIGFDPRAGGQSSPRISDCVLTPRHAPECKGSPDDRQGAFLQHPPSISPRCIRRRMLAGLFVVRYAFALGSVWLRCFFWALGGNSGAAVP